ncbi:MAG: hypothetical protein Q8934_15610 [Bacillota bacterium]|nr:hypothetical protein [Bacillota bacterium]
MKLILERLELSILLLHMNIMRKPIKKGLKTKYGHYEARKIIKIYDDLKERFENQLSVETEPIDFYLNEQELDMLHSFITWYIAEIQASAKDQGANLKNDEQVIILEQITERVNALVKITANELPKNIN